jgi:hypothetical protein
MFGFNLTRRQFWLPPLLPSRWNGRSVGQDCFGPGYGLASIGVDSHDRSPFSIC